MKSDKPPREFISRDEAFSVTITLFKELQEKHTALLEKCAEYEKALVEIKTKPKEFMSASILQNISRQVLEKWNGKV